MTDGGAGASERTDVSADLRARLRELFDLGRGDGRRLLSMEGMRGLAVLLVFFVHYITLARPYITTDTQTAFWTSVKHVGHLGIDVFFTLSGYLIYGVLIRKHRPFGTFMLRRIERLYPTFLVMFFIYVALSLIVPSESKLPEGATATLIYLIENILLLPGILPIEPMMTVAWTLSYEMFFYLTLPVLISALRMRTWPVSWRIGGIFILTLVISQTFGSPYYRLGMFACGILVFECVNLAKQNPAIFAKAAKWIDSLTLVIVLVTISVFMAYTPYGRAAFSLTFLCCFMLCASAFAHKGWLARFFEGLFLRGLGNISYSYYLLHGLVLKFIFFALAMAAIPVDAYDLVFYGLLPVSFTATLICSALLYLSIERPLSILPERRRLAELRGDQKP